MVKKIAYLALAILFAFVPLYAADGQSEELTGTWWYDRNWHTKLISPTPNVRPETFGMYLFEEITRNFYRKKAGRPEQSREESRKPLEKSSGKCFLWSCRTLQRRQ